MLCSRNVCITCLLPSGALAAQLNVLCNLTCPVQLQDEDGQGRPGRYSAAGAANASLAAHAIKAGKVSLFSGLWNSSRLQLVDEMLFPFHLATYSATAVIHLQAAVVVARVAKAASGPVTDALEPLHEALAMAPAAGKVCTSLHIVRCTTSGNHCGDGVIVEILCCARGLS